MAQVADESGTTTQEKTDTVTPQSAGLNLSLNEAIEVALQGNPSMRQALENLAVAEGQHDLAQTPYRMTIDFDTEAYSRFVGVHEIGGQTVLNTTRSAQEGQPVYDRIGNLDFRSEDHEQIDLSQRITRTFRNAHTLQFETTENLLQDSLRYYDDDPYKNHDFQNAARVSYTIPFNSRERLSIRTDLQNADLSYTQAMNTLNSRREQVIYQVNTAYWNLKYSEADLAIQRDYLAQSRRTYESFQIQKEYGFVSDFDVKQSRVAMRQIEASLLSRETQIQNEYEDFNLLLGLPINFNIDLTDPLEAPKVERSDEEYIDLALSTNLNLKNLRLSLEQSENSLAVTKLGQQPNVDFVTSYQRDDGGDSVGNFLFQVSWPFGDGGATKARVRVSENRIDGQRIEIWDEERSLRLQKYIHLKRFQKLQILGFFEKRHLGNANILLTIAIVLKNLFLSDTRVFLLYI